MRRLIDPERHGELRPMRFDGERRRMLAIGLDRAHEGGALCDDVIEALAAEMEEARRAADAVLAYGFAPAELADGLFARLGFTSLGPVPVLTRPLRLSAALSSFGSFGVAASLPELPLLLPFGRTRRAGFREIEAKKEPRVTRLWDRFSIDVLSAVERTAAYLDPRVFEHLGDGPLRVVGPQAQDGHRVFVFEDGDRYVIRALCVFRVAVEAGGVRGYVTELLHDRSLAGMRAASHLLGIALREMSDAGAETAIAWSLQHSGSFPILARHGFFGGGSGPALRFGVRAFEPEVEASVTKRESWYLSLLDAVEG